jgi:hypothetical protein
VNLLAASAETSVESEHRLGKRGASAWISGTSEMTHSRRTPMGTAAMPAPAGGAPEVDTEHLFEELALRLEQAVSEQGIDLEP